MKSAKEFMKDYGSIPSPFSSNASVTLYNSIQVEEMLNEFANQTLQDFFVRTNEHVCSKNGLKKKGESCTLNNNCIYPLCALK